MPSVDEALGLRKTELSGDLAAGVQAISYNQEVQFQRYTRTVLPLDGYVFWVKDTGADATKQVMGSLHYATQTRQEAEENYAANAMVFSALSVVNDLNEVARDKLWIGTYEGLQFAFDSRGRWYTQAGVQHYVGYAVYPDMATQVVDNADDLDPDRVIVSNSLPIWLMLNTYVPPNRGAGLPMPSDLTLYPAFLTPQSMEPPFASVEIIDSTTTSIAAAPTIQSDSSSYELVQETVKITLWGVRNDDALLFRDCVDDYSLAYNWMGIMNSPVIRDEKRIQSELSTLAQKKSVTFEISYYQYTAREIARQLIETAKATFIVNGA